MKTMILNAFGTITEGYETNFANYEKEEKGGDEK